MPKSDGSESVQCSICGAELPNPEFARNYPNVVCRDCEKRALNNRGELPHHDTMGDFGDNPVFIDGLKCWRRYRFGGFVTMKDEHDCASIMEFYERHLPQK